MARSWAPPSRPRSMCSSPSRSSRARRSTGRGWRIGSTSCRSAAPARSSTRCGWRARQEVPAQVESEPGRPLAAPGVGHAAGPRSQPPARGSGVTDFLLQVVGEAWSILREASLFLLLGFVLAGVFAVIVPARLLTRFLGRGKIRSVLWASAIGTPLPLCSCGVLPTALGLARQGATRGATVAFLISTPEIGVDSIALSYALMDPIITVFRPIAAFITATVAGIATNFLGVKRQPAAAETSDGATAAEGPEAPAPA